MSIDSKARTAIVGLALAGLTLAGCSPNGDEEAAPAPRIIQPGAPGEPSRELTPEEAAELLELPPPTDDDIQFMLDMIPHHVQALRMTRLVEGRTASERIPLFAERMDLSQADELKVIQDWLEKHEVEVPSLLMDHEHGEGMEGLEGQLMPGMLTEEELAQLESLEGEAFDRMFLESMIRHHQGAIQMVDTLFSGDDNAIEPELWRFANHIYSDQSIEISRMLEMLAEMEAADAGDR